MKKKTVIIIVAVVVVVALAAAIVVPMVTGKKSGDNGAVNGKESTTQGSANGGTANNQNGTNSNGTSGGDGGSGYVPSSDPSSNPTTSGEQASDAASNPIPTISFPYAISGSDLVVEQVSSYTGYYLEDASDREVADIAVIVLTNNGPDLEFAGIGISQGSRNLAFSASQIPAGATIIIQEQNGSAFDMDAPYYTATATTTPADGFEMSKEYVSVKDNGDNTFTVRNITDQTLSEVKVYFKNFLPDEDVFVGGITYSVTLNNIEVGTEVDVSSNHYDSQYSEIVEVLAEW